MLVSSKSSSDIITIKIDKKKILKNCKKSQEDKQTKRLFKIKIWAVKWT